MTETTEKPTPKQTDELIARYAELDGMADAAAAAAKKARETADAVKADLVKMVQAFGVKHAEKSMRLAGARNTATVTVGTQIVVVAEGVGKLQAFCESSEMPGLRERLFRECVSYHLVEAPEETIRTMELPAKVRSRLVSLAKACFAIKTKNPSLKVDVPALQKAA